MSIDLDPDPASAPPVVAGRRRRAPLTVLCWLLVAPGLGWAAVRLGGLERGPLVQLLAFTPYLAAWTVVPLGLALAVRRWWAAGAAALAAIVLVCLVAPRALADEPPVAGGPTLRVLTANLLAGAAEPDAVVALVRTHRVDLLAVQEFTPDAEAALDRLGLAGLLPYRQANAESGTTGSALYSRLPLRDTGTRRNGGGFSQAYGTVRPDAGPAVLVESVHPMAPATLSSLSAWHDDLRTQPSATPAGPLRILAGDFNATLDHAELRRLLDTGYADSAASVGAGLTGTWGPYDGDPIPPVVIDHVLVDRRIAVRRVAVFPLPGSDHRPVLAEVALPAQSP
ncbi:endonuclease/exonuclease/phosphatase family protein [Plantactinospora soyae]|uniref:Endonuclease/exonuclease/phosphatase (EEP) superfamily protein YafD n=1 Tax=Plantactinospora soyae TaxID=1544732 RepID=A0A927QZL7_9ACTN|nr:endonuclease/exonuclease/phosphatase family protein [Plantactinospora soyae]MBE1487738.1 endonuclease/exonuclease/phosphatase (EEP) superfamily protein YafD [Plantactinospora soyae]